MSSNTVLKPFVPSEPLWARQLEGWLAWYRQPARAGSCHGLESFLVGQSLRCERRGESLRVVATHLHGTTPDHTSILLRDEVHEATLELGGAEHVRFDACLRVNRPGIDPSSARDVAVSLVLVPKNGEASGVPRAQGLALGLHEYRRTGEQLALVRRARVRRLSAIRPHDERWRAWVEPLWSALRSMGESFLSGRLDASPRATACAAHLSHLLASWSSLELDDLQRELEIATRIAQASLAQGAGLVDQLHPQPLEPPSDWEAADGEQQVARLAAALERWMGRVPSGYRRLRAPEEYEWQWLNEYSAALELRTQLAGGRLLLCFRESRGLTRSIQLRCLDLPKRQIAAREDEDGLAFELPPEVLRSGERLVISGLREGPHECPLPEVLLQPRHVDSIRATR